MKKTLVLATLFACTTLLFTTPAFAQKTSVEEVNAAQATKGRKIRGPRTIKPVRVNNIRYRVQVKSDVSFTPGPSLALPFIPQIPGAEPGDSGASALTETELRENLDNARRAHDAEREFMAIREAQKELIARRANQIQGPISALLANTKRAVDATNSYLGESDTRLARSNGPELVLAPLRGLIATITTSIGGRWPDDEINEYLRDVDTWESELGRISDLKWLADNKDRVDAVKALFKELRESVTALSHNGQPDSVATKFDEAQRVLGAWKAIFDEAITADTPQEREDYFSLQPVKEDCGFAFDQTKSNIITLVKQDRVSSETTLSEQELVTVVCSSPLSISGGFGFSTINEREFVFVTSTKTVTENGQPVEKVINRFGFENNSSFRPIPLLLLNTRFYEFNDQFALHLSAGAGVDIKTGEAGSDVEFIVGPSVSFNRSLFITAGAHIGRVPKLAGGFELNQEVPEGIDKPPIEKSWKPGFIFALTFKIR
jgi:hypothetical protein